MSNCVKCISGLLCLFETFLKRFISGTLVVFFDIAHSQFQLARLSLSSFTDPWRTVAARPFLEKYLNHCFYESCCFPSSDLIFCLTYFLKLMFAKNASEKIYRSCPWMIRLRVDGHSIRFCIFFLMHF